MIPDSFHRLIQKAIDEKNPQSPEELQEVLNSFIGMKLDQIEANVSNKEKTPAEKARDLVWAAQSVPVARGRAKAKRALKLDPNCIEAYEFLAGSYQTFEKIIPCLEKGVAIGRRIYGGDYLKENKGRFWGLIETRPFMRCFGGLAECSYLIGQTRKAIEIWKEMLILNPNDNQGIRDKLAPALLEIKDLKGYDKMIEPYKDDITAGIAFNNTLRQFMEKGGTKEVENLLKEGQSRNKHVIPLLLATYPPDEMPSSYTLGSRDEAILYAHSAWRAWASNKAAQSWLKNIAI